MATWDFIVCDGSGTQLVTLTRHQGTSLTFTRNGVPECQFSLSHDDDECSTILSALANGTGGGVPTLKAYRTGSNGTRVLRFNGYLAGTSEESGVDASTATFTFRGPFGRLLGDGSNRGRFVSTGVTFAATDAGQIAKSLIDTANGIAPTGVLTLGTIQATKARDRVYPIGQPVGEAIVNLTNVLDGFDFEVSPVETGHSQLQLSPPQNLRGGSNSLFPLDAYYVVTAVDASGGETTSSNERFQSGGGPYYSSMAWDPVPGAVAYRVYRSSSSGGETTSPAFCGQTTSTSFVDSGAANSPGAAPLVNTTAVGILTGVGIFNVYASQGGDKPAAKFEYGPDTLANCSAMHRQTLPPINYVTIIGANGLFSTKLDATSIARYGRFEFLEARTDVSDQATLDDIATANIRPNPVKTIDFTPEPSLAPSPFDDFGIGDTGRFYANRGALLEGPVSVRINQITVVIDPDSGLEATEIPNPVNPEEERVIRASLQTEVATGAVV